MALCKPELCFWPAKTRENLNFLRWTHVFDLVLKFSSDINERNWLKLLFYLIFLLDMVASIIGMSFLSVFQVLGCIFLVLLCQGNVCKWNPKPFWPRLGFFGVFCWSMPNFVDLISAWTKVCMNCSIIILFWRHQFFRLFERYSVLFQICLYVLSIGFCLNWLKSFSNAMQLQFLFFCVF